MVAADEALRLRDSGWDETGTRPRLGSLGEDGLLARLITLAGAGRGLELGPGDDAASWLPRGPRVLVSTDSLVEGVHFERRRQSPYQVGVKAWGAAASDLAAMGAEVELGVVAAVLPAGTSVEAVEAIQLGLVEAAAADQAAIAGGDISSGSGPLVLNVTVLGSISEGAPVMMSGARAGDLLVLTGEVGGAAGCLELFSHGEARVPLSWRSRLVAPRARIAEGCELRRAGVSAMTDLSDGLLLDASRMAAASRARAELWADRIPLIPDLEERFGKDAVRLGATGGEDYELLACVPEPLVEELLRGWPVKLQPLTLVGRMSDGAGVVLLEREGGPELSLGDALGYQHY
jgi:thiamine-monophosphate kinase